MDIDTDFLAKIADCFSIVHHTPGRIRLRANTNLATIATKERTDLLSSIKAIPFIKDLKLNLLIGSVTVQYDTSIFEPTLWESWLKKERLTEILALIKTHLKDL